MPDMKSELAKIAPALSTINFDDEPGGSPQLQVLEPSHKRAPAGSIRKRVIAHLKTVQEATAAELSAAVGAKYAGFGTTLRKMVDAGDIARRQAKGAYLYLYYLPQVAAAPAAPAAPSATSADAIQVGGSHYKDMAIQPWAVMEMVLTPEEFRGFLRGNVLKYAMRAGRKEGSDDSGKAQHYMQKLAEFNEKMHKMRNG